MKPADSFPAPPAPALAAADESIDAVIEEPEVRGPTSEVRGEDVSSGQTSAVSADADAASPPAAADPGPRPPTTEPPPVLGGARERELEELGSVVHSGPRTEILFALAEPATGGRGGPANVGALARRTGIEPPDKLGSHLGKLKDLGLLFCQRKGKEKWYEINPDRVRYERTETGAKRLTITARSTGITVTISIPTAREV